MDNIEISADVIVRYLSLIRYLEAATGYGTFVLTVHGKRPVKIAKLQRQIVLENYTKLP